jgi:hypothetical protein
MLKPHKHKTHLIITILTVLIISSCNNTFKVKDRNGQESKIRLYKWKNIFSESIQNDNDITYTGRWKGILKEQDTIITVADDMIGTIPLSNNITKYYIFENGQLNPIYPNYPLF